MHQQAKAGALPEDLRAIVDEAFFSVKASLQANGYQAATDERAQTLKQALAVYLIESNPDLLGHVSQDERK